MDSILSSNVRDKIILGSFLIFGILSFVGIFMGKPLEGTLGTIMTGLFAIYKGNPTTPGAKTNGLQTEAKTETKVTE